MCLFLLSATMNEDYKAEYVETKKIHVFENFQALLACVTNLFHKSQYVEYKADLTGNAPVRKIPL